MRLFLAAFEVSTPGSAFDLIERAAQTVIAKICNEYHVRIRLRNYLRRCHPLHSV